jgi:adenylosuccinate synthase
MIRAVIGAQFGDEGKGKIVDYLAQDADMVVRFCGGANAGHTVEFDNGDRHAVHMLPAGVFRENVTSVMSGGMVIDPIELVKEIQDVQKIIDHELRLEIDWRIGIVTQEHKRLDMSSEESSEIKLGTTQKGNGPAYASRASRSILQLSDLIYDEDFLWKTSPLIAQELIRAAKYLKPYVKDTVETLNDAIYAGKNILFAGAHGTLLDILHGTYPYVTSSGCTAGYIGHSCGIDPRCIDEVIGVVKSYITRIGTGPLPTEIQDKEKADWIREKGREYGTTTGRPRRIGWFDLPLLKYSAKLNGFDYIALTMTDIIRELQEYTVVTDYAYRPGRNGLNDVTPMVQEIWTDPDQLIQLIQRHVASVRLISYGPKRSQLLEIGG